MSHDKNARTREQGRPITEGEKDRFLEALAAGESVVDAAEASGRARRSFYRLRAEDEEFATAWAAAYDEGTDALIAEAERRAVEGVAEPRMVGYGENAELITVRKYSDTLLIFLLKARRPKVFRDNVKVEHGGPDGKPIGVEVTVGDQLAERLVEGLVERGLIRLGPAAAADPSG